MSGNERYTRRIQELESLHSAVQDADNVTPHPRHLSVDEDPNEITLPDELLSSIELQFDRRAEFSERRSTIELGILARQFGWTAIVRVFDEIAEKDWAEGADA